MKRHIELSPFVFIVLCCKVGGRARRPRCIESFCLKLRLLPQQDIKCGDGDSPKTD